MGPAALFVGGFAAGLAAGTASCTAVQGGLLVGLTRPSRSATRPEPEPVGPDPSHSPSPAAGHGSGRPTATDAIAVGAFLSGRLASHTLAGALLGMAGSAVRLGAPVRAALLVGAGLMVMVFAIGLIRHREAPGCSPGRPDPRPVVRSPVRRGLSLGAATVLVPCGVTISMEVAAVSTGSALAGAAAMAGFVLGTAPAFAVLGLLLRRLSSTRLAALTGVVALIAGLVTVSSGLRLGGWLPELGGTAFGLAAGAGTRANTAASAGPGGVQQITVWATERGFRPGIATARAGRPLEIVFRTRDNHGCTRTVSVDGDDVVLPVTGQGVVRLASRPPGDLRYACGMGMYAGFIRFTVP
ncbi:sulfite exporter TauE/SafE family protein [Microtetraspora sp. AC03309]|uniref:urease accessory protein UreH domain-containing protein n=1 Tax=Microtetraspora sp. AC03309 TaxID=2779376 RepID=UPI001E36F823|nr:sulfite exporter TauE/SafE family protein [Microtetraspora sp. AC03309]MCC5574752.1 sulfite exporter TauE/SafE family protein [Microtetraspora sp. AC03309]